MKVDSIAAGLNNRRPDFKLERRTREGTENFVRAAVNTDITAEGSGKRRRGFATAIVGSACHSLWADDANEAMYFVDAGDLKRVTGSSDAPIATVMRAGLGVASLSYADTLAGAVYYTNSEVLRRIDAGGDRTAGVPAPAVLPSLTASGSGAIPAGRYQLIATYVDAYGEESAATPSCQAEAAADQTLVVTSLPSTWPTGVVALRLYLTSTNGATLLKASELSVPAATVTFASMPPLGARCVTSLLAPMPAGQIVRECNGRLMVAVGSMLIYSEPYAYGLFDPTRNFIPFPAQITMMEPCGEGFYIAAESTYWIGGDITKTELTLVLPYGAVPRTGAAVPNSDDVWWMSERGRVLGAADGSVKALEEPNVIVPRAQFGASMFRESDGMKQAITSLFGLESTNMAAGSFMDAEIIRKGTTL